MIFGMNIVDKNRNAIIFENLHRLNICSFPDIATAKEHNHMHLSSLFLAIIKS